MKRIDIMKFEWRYLTNKTFVYNHRNVLLSRSMLHQSSFIIVFNKQLYLFNVARNIYFNRFNISRIRLNCILRCNNLQKCQTTTHDTSVKFWIFKKWKISTSDISSILTNLLFKILEYQRTFLIKNRSWHV